MLQENEILGLVLNASSIAKQLEKNDKYKKDIPSYYPLYRESVSNMDAIRVHAEKGIFPEKLFLNKSPNQTDQEAEYIKNNYHQTTLPVFMDYQSTVGRAFHDANWSISYNKDDNDVLENNGLGFQSYVENEIHIYGSIENFVKSILPSVKSIDAMGVIAVKPYEIPTEENEEGETVVKSDSLYEPVPFYYKSSQIVDFEEDEYYLIELTEKSLVEFAGTNQKKGRVYELYDEQNIYRIKQVGKYVDDKFEVELYYNHAEGKVPVTRLKGVPKYEDGQILWQSPFLFAVDNLDLVAMNSSNLQISINKCVFPTAILLGDECDFENLEHGVKCIDGAYFVEGKAMTCPKCNGSGLKSRLSVTGQMIVKGTDRNGNSELSSSQKAVEFVAPDTAVLDFLEKNIERNESRARKILHLKDNSTQTNFNVDNKTATGSNNNEKALYAFVKTVSDQTFEIYEFVLNRIGWQRYQTKYKGIELVYPNSFDFTTEDDYLVQISEAIKAGLPPFVIHTIIYKFLKAMFFSEKKTSNAFNLIIDTDRLLTLSNDDIALKLAKGTVDKWEEILHTSAITFVNELVMEDPKFFEKDIKDQKTALIEKAKAVAASIKPATTVKTTVDNILGVA